MQLTLPADVAAVDGRAFFDTNAMDLVGLAPVGGGHVFAPVDISGGAAFGAYGLKPGKSGTVLRFVVVPHASGSRTINVVIDSEANASGSRLPTGGTSADVAPHRLAGPTRTLVGQPVLTSRDLDQVAAAWQFSRENGGACSSPETTDDANNDGCIDAVDVQAISAGVGQPSALNPQVPMVNRAAQLTGAQALAQANQFGSPTAARTMSISSTAVTYTRTFTVTSAVDSADANPGDGLCADSEGRCTLRAAMTEANWSTGSDFIGFNIPGIAPVQITIGSVLPFLNDPTGGTTIDAYTEPGSQVNTAQYGIKRGTRYRHSGHGGYSTDEHLLYHQRAQRNSRFRPLPSTPDHRHGLRHRNR